MSGSYIVAGARTPIGKMSGVLASFSAADLGGFAIAAALPASAQELVPYQQFTLPNGLRDRKSVV